MYQANIDFTIKSFNELEKYESKFVASSFKNKEPDIVYRLKEKNIFFLIEHQSRIDYSMPHRILEYSLAIINSANNGKKPKNKSDKLPRVFSIVIYSGSKQWDAEKSLKNRLETINKYSNPDLSEYQLIDINSFNNYELLHCNSFLPKALLIESCNNAIKLIESVEKIVNLEIHKKNNDETIALLKSIIGIVLTDKLTKEQSQKYIKILNSRGVDTMLNCVKVMRAGYKAERKAGIAEGRKFGIIEGRKSGLAEGISKTKKETAKNFLKLGVNIDIIIKATGLSKEELENLNNE